LTETTLVLIQASTLSEYDYDVYDVYDGSLQLFEYPGDIVRLSCEKCGRSGQYRKQNLIEDTGPIFAWREA